MPREGGAAPSNEPPAKRSKAEELASNLEPEHLFVRKHKVGMGNTLPPSPSQKKCFPLVCLYACWGWLGLVSAIHFDLKGEGDGARNIGSVPVFMFMFVFRALVFSCRASLTCLPQYLWMMRRLG